MSGAPTQTESSFSGKRSLSRAYPFVFITQEMIDEAKKMIPTTEVKRTVASKIDTLTGHLGEFVFAQYLFGNWKKHQVGKNKGKTDFEDIEVKASAFPFSEKLHLLVREDYAKKRKPNYYVQIILDVDSTKAETICPKTRAFICGFASADEIDRAPKRDFGSKLGRRGGYKCHYILIGDLHSMTALRKELRGI